MNFFQHPSNTRALGAPKGVAIEDCRALPVTDIQIRLFDGTLGTIPGIVSFWKPTPEELQKLNAGEPVYLQVWDRTHCPLYIGVGTPFVES
jgi:hypothetical protein